MQERVKLQRRLQKYCSRKISKLGLGVTPSCRTLIERMINNGIERMVGQGAIEREEQIVIAEQNLSQYLQKLAAEAKSRGTYPQVGAKAFDSVFNAECPIWPFC